MSYYKITNVAAGKCLNIYGNNVTSLSKNQNVVLWTDSGSAEQRWVIDSLGTGVLVKSAVNSSFALNAFRSSATKYNCDVYPWSGNEADAKVNFEPVSGGYRIKLTNYNMYLTAGGTANGADVYWAAATGNTSQVWICTDVGNLAPKNQTYEVSNGLHVITTRASNIKLLNQRVVSKQQTMKASGYCGINGAWFNLGGNQAILNIAVQDGKCVGPGTQGTANEDVGSCIIAWDGSSAHFYSGALNATPMLSQGSAYLKAGTWIQGGIGLWLGYSDWLSLYRDQDSGASMAYYNGGSARRTGLIAGLSGQSAGMVKLVVSANALTVNGFRAAIQAYLGISDGPQMNGVYQALMLDGGGSSEMVAKNALGQTIVFPANQERGIPEIITLKDPN